MVYEQLTPERPNIIGTDRKALESAGHGGVKPDEYVSLADLFEDVVAIADDCAIDAANTCGKILRIRRSADGTGRPIWSSLNIVAPKM